MTKSKIDTLLLDIDGCIFSEVPNARHFEEILGGHKTPTILPGVAQFLADWVHIGNKLILTTGRSENFREITKKQLDFYGISYDALVMNAGTGIRIVINNDSSVDGSSRALALSIPTNDSFPELLKQKLGIKI